MEGQDASQLVVPPFLPESHLPPPWCTFGAVGMKGSGKSALAARATLWYFRDKLETVISFVPTSKSNGDPAFFVPKAFDYDDWDPDRCQKIYDWWKSNDEKRVKEGRPRQHVMFLIDDCNAVADKKGKLINVYKSVPIIKLLKEGRHHLEGIFMCAQNATDLPPEARNQLHMVFLFGSNSEKEIEWMRMAWASHCPKKLWPLILRGCTACTDPYKKKCLVIDLRRIDATNPISGMYVWQPPYISKPFRCGRADYYALSTRTFKEPEAVTLDPWAAGGKDAGSSTARRGMVHVGRKKKVEQEPSVFISNPITERILSDAEAAAGRAEEEEAADAYEEDADEYEDDSER